MTKLRFPDLKPSQASLFETDDENAYGVGLFLRR